MRPRVDRTMSFVSAKFGEAASTLAPRERKIRAPCSATAATSESTGMSPSRSGVHATRHPVTTGVRTAFTNSRVSTGYEIGERSSGPAITESIKAVSATLRAIGPWTENWSQASSRG
jgi:hypothetical protein